MTWRHFLHLLGGLPADSRLVTTLQHEKKQRAKRRSYDSQEALDDAMDEAYGG